MKKFKKIIVMCVIAIMTLSLVNVGAYAQENEYEIEIPIISVAQDATESEINEAIETAINEELLQPRASILTITPFLIRSGNTSSCQLYERWSCPGYQCSMISFSSLRLHNNSILSPVTYSNIGGSTIQCQTGSSGSAFVRNVTIPTSVSTVYVTQTDVMAYILNEGWVSTVSHTVKVPFN